MRESARRTEEALTRRREVSFTRIATDDRGRSCFQDDSVPLEASDFAPPAPPLDTSAPEDAERVVFMSGPTDWVGDWHPAPTRQYALILRGEFTVTAGSGEVRVFRAGDVVLLEDTDGQGHRTHITEEGLIAMVQLE